MKKIKELFKQVNHISPAAKASMVLMVTQMLQKGLSIITSPIYTRILSSQEYGQVSLFFSWYEIFVIFTGLCLSKGVFNNGMVKYKDDKDVFTLSLYSLTVISTLIVGSITFAFCKYVHNFLHMPFKLIIYMFILLAFEAALSLWTVKQRFEYKYKATSAVTILIAIVSPVCGIVGIYLFSKNKVMARIIGARNVFLVVYIIILIYLFVKAHGVIRIYYWKYALKFNLALLPHYLSLHILNHMDRIMISSIVGATEAGIYTVAYNGAAIMKIFWQSVNASLIPWTYEKCERKDFESLSDLTKMLVLGYSFVCVVFMFLAPEIMRLLAPSSYHEGVYVIPSVIAGVFFSALYYIFANVVYYYEKPQYVMIGSICSAVINIVLNWIFIPIFGYLAAGYTTMVSYIFQVLIDYCAMRSILKTDIYDVKFIICISLGMIVIDILLSFLYSYLVVRLFMFALFCLYVIFYGKKYLKQYVIFFVKKAKI